MSYSKIKSGTEQLDFCQYFDENCKIELMEKPPKFQTVLMETKR
jgi:hypothetical protein